MSQATAELQPPKATLPHIPINASEETMIYGQVRAYKYGRNANPPSSCATGTCVLHEVTPRIGPPLPYRV